MCVCVCMEGVLLQSWSYPGPLEEAFTIPPEVGGPPSCDHVVKGPRGAFFQTPGTLPSVPHWHPDDVHTHMHTHVHTHSVLLSTAVPVRQSALSSREDGVPCCVSQISLPGCKSAVSQPRALSGLKGKQAVSEEDPSSSILCGEACGTQ